MKSHTNVVHKKSRLESFFGKTFTHVMILLVTFIWALPTVGLLISSLRPRGDITSTGWWTVFQHPFDFTWVSLDNYINVLTAQGLGRSFINSLTITIPSTLIPIAVAAFAAYAFAWMEFPGRQVLFVVVVGLLVVPLQMTLIPLLRVYTKLGWNGTFFGIWLAHTGYGLPFSIYLLRNYIGGLPKDIFESAYLDGASHIKVFFWLVVPLSVPALASLAIFQFVWVWNDLLVSLIYLGGEAEKSAITLRLASMVQSMGQEWHLLMAGAFIVMVLPMLIFFLMQRYFVRGITAGAVKG